MDVEQQRNSNGTLNTSTSMATTATVGGDGGQPINGVLHFNKHNGGGHAHRYQHTNGYTNGGSYPSTSPKFQQQSRFRSRSFYKWLSVGMTLFCTGLLLVCVALILTFWTRLQDRDKKLDHLGVHGWPKPSGSLFAEYKRAAIATDHGFCSEIGRDVMIEGGNAIDAAIASLACVGVVNPQSSGIGGGLLMSVYHAASKRCVTINARESAPNAANQTMFVGKPREAIHGYRAIAVPGEVHGLWTAFKRFGSGQVSWARLWTPAVQLARDGFPVSANLAFILNHHKKDIAADPEMKKAFFNPKTDTVFAEGELLKRPKLAHFLSELANASDPVQLFYKGSIATHIAEEMSQNGGMITREDLASYEPLVDESPLLAEGALPRSLVMCGPKPPAGNAVINGIVGIMNQFYGSEARGKESGVSIDLDDPLLYHRLIEAEKFGYAQRAELGDSAFVPQALVLAQNLSTPDFHRQLAQMITTMAQPLEFYQLKLPKHALGEDHGTSHVSAIDRQGNAVSVTSSVNQWLGAMRVSPKLGFIWNDEMDDFSTPGQPNLFGFAPSPSNFIVPGKRPQSSMAPLVIFNATSGQVKMAIGASGGARIISSIAQTIIRSLLLGQTVKEAVDAPRLHNQFVPFTTEYEVPMPEWIVDALEQSYGQQMVGIDKQASVVQALVYDDRTQVIYGNSDFRRKTATFPAGF